MAEVRRIDPFAEGGQALSNSTAQSPPGSSPSAIVSDAVDSYPLETIGTQADTSFAPHSTDAAEAILENLRTFNFSNSLGRFVDAIRRVTAGHQLSDGDLERLAADAAVDTNARQVLMATFATDALARALYKAKASGIKGSANVEALVEGGIDSMAQALMAYLTLPPSRRNGVRSYVRGAIFKGVAQEARQVLLGHDFSSRINETRYLRRYREWCQNFENEQGRAPSDAEAAAEFHITIDRAMALRALTQRTIVLSEIDEEIMTTIHPLFGEQDETQPTDEDAEILIERALEFLPPNRKEIVSRRFGLGGNPMSSVQEIAQYLGIDEPYVSYSTSKALQDLREIIIRLRFGFDEQFLRKTFSDRNLNGRNAVAFFYRAGLDLPGTARLPELRRLASDLLRQQDDISLRDREIISMLYRLDSSGETLTQSQVAERFGLRKSAIGLVEKRVFQKLRLRSG